MAYPYGYTIFCDDIRQEVGGKVSLVGVYRHVLFIRGDFPFTLPKFAMSIVYTELQSECPPKVELRVIFPGDDENNPTIAGEIGLPQTSAKTTSPLQDLVVKDPDDDGFRINQGFAQIILSPLVLQKEGSIRVRVKRGDEIVRLGRLLVAKAPPNLEIK